MYRHAISYKHIVTISNCSLTRQVSVSNLDPNIITYEANTFPVEALDPYLSSNTFLLEKYTTTVQRNELYIYNIYNIYNPQNRGVKDLTTVEVLR
jgi:hypothetical protein